MYFNLDREGTELEYLKKLVARIGFAIFDIVVEYWYVFAAIALFFLSFLSYGIFGHPKLQCEKEAREAGMSERGVAIKCDRRTLP